MGELPDSTLWINVFGQYIIRVRTSNLIRYCVLFTCLSSRVAHIQVVHPISTDESILLLQRLIAQGGNVRTIGPTMEAILLVLKMR